MRKSLALFALALPTFGCSFHARSPDDYRDATAAVLATKSADVKACYDTALKTTPTLAGTVTVTFTVEKSTGKLTNVSVAAGSAAPQALSDCVTTSLAGLTLAPPDKRNGDATWDYAFAVGKS